METQRAESARARRAAAARAWGTASPVVLVAAGQAPPIEGTDQFHEFHAHPEFRYLAGAAIPRSVLAFDPGEGWTLFVPVPSREDRVWLGDSEPLEAVRERAGIDAVSPLEALGPWAEARRGSVFASLGNEDLVVSPSRYGLTGWGRFETGFDRELSARLSEQVSELRRAKDGWELERMQAAADASRAGHLLALRTARAGMTERRLQVELEAEFFRAGGDRTAYGTIVGSGPNGAVLHFSPTGRVLREGDLVLIDAGAECDGYASDVTRTFPAGRSFSGAQRDLYQVVLGVQEAAIRDVRPGKEYRELHLEAAARIADGLVQAGILRGPVGDLVERDAHALFFPHGLGHMLGLSTHDAGGCLAGRPPSDRFGLKWLRADLPLEAGYVVTIEPGIYFIPALLDDPDTRRQYRDDVNWERVDSLQGFGGIRIEDDVLVTAGEAEVLSGALPKDVRTIEALRAEAFA